MSVVSQLDISQLDISQADVSCQSAGCESTGSDTSAQIQQALCQLCTRTLAQVQMTCSNADGGTDTACFDGSRGGERREEGAERP